MSQGKKPNEKKFHGLQDKDRGAQYRLRELKRFFLVGGGGYKMLKTKSRTISGMILNTFGTINMPN